VNSASDYLDWKVEDDAVNVRDSALENRAETARDVYLRCFESAKNARAFLQTPRTYWRHRVLEKFEIFAGHPLRGRVMEIGAGTGWCSAVISRLPAVSEVFALEYDPYCIQTLIPRAHAALEAETAKVRRVLGSFNTMKCDAGSFDLVVSIGALHHSENLAITLAESFRILAPGGWLIASELCAPNGVTQQEQWLKENTPVNGVTWRDTSNHYYRVCEYEAAAFAAGFDTHAFAFDATTASGGRIAQLRRKAREYLRGDAMFRRETGVDQGYSRDAAYPYFARDAFGKKPPLYDALVLFLQKPVRPPGA